MEHSLTDLPYTMDGTAAQMTQSTFEYRCGLHHLGYLNNFNRLNKGSVFERLSLETIILIAPAGDICKAAAQVWNHTFFWRSMEQNGGGIPDGELADAINRKWGSFDEFKKAFRTIAVGNRSSGWTWLVKRADGSLDIDNMSGDGTPLTTTDKPLLCIDISEHTHYPEYRKMRTGFVETFLNKLANWDFAAKNFA
ncbi:MAG: Fe-Mn family superoxide dismutase [Gallionellaceae bacterium]